MNKHSTEPALMSLVAVAKAIADKKFSSREVTQSCLNRIAEWQPRLNAFMAIEAESALAGRRCSRCRAFAKGKPRRRCMACRWRTRTCITTPARS